MRSLSFISLGPLRTIVKVEDRGWNPLYPESCIAADRIDITTIYTLCAGRRDSAVYVSFKWDGSKFQRATGVINVKNSVEFSDNKGLRGCWGTDWPVSEKDSAVHKREPVGLGIYIPAAYVVSELPANNDNYPYVVSPTDSSLHYAITFASDNETFDGSRHSSKSFFDYLKKWKTELGKPVTISVKDLC